MTFTSAQHPAEAKDTMTVVTNAKLSDHHRGAKDKTSVVKEEPMPFTPDIHATPTPVITKVLEYLASLPSSKIASDNASVNKGTHAKLEEDEHPGMRRKIDREDVANTSAQAMTGSYPEDVVMAAPPNSVASPSPGVNALPNKPDSMPMNSGFKPIVELPKRRRFQSINDAGDSPNPTTPIKLTNRFHLLLKGDDVANEPDNMHEPAKKAPFSIKPRPDKSKGRRAKTYNLRSRKAKTSENGILPVTKQHVPAQMQNRKPCVEIMVPASRVPNSNATKDGQPAKAPENRVQQQMAGFGPSRHYPPKRTVGDAFRRLDEMSDLVMKMHDSYDEEMTAIRRELEKRLDCVENAVEDAADALVVDDVRDEISRLWRTQQGVRSDIDTCIRDMAREHVSMEEKSKELNWDLDSLRQAIGEHGDWSRNTEDTIAKLSQVLAGTEENMKQLNKYSQMLPRIDEMENRVEKIERELKNNNSETREVMIGAQSGTTSLHSGSPVLMTLVAPIQSAVDSVIFRMEVLEKSVHRLATAHNHVVRSFELASVTVPKQGSGEYTKEIIETIAGHWEWHLTNAARATGIPGIERIVDDSLQARAVNLHDTPSAAAAIVRRAYEHVMFVFSHKEQGDRDDIGMAKTVLHLYTLLRPVVHEALSSIDALSKDKFQDDAGLRDAVIELVNFLRAMVKAARIVDISIFFDNTPNSKNTKRQPFESRLPIITGPRDKILLNYRPRTEHPSFFTPSCDTSCRHHPMVLWKRFFINQHPVLGEVNVPIVVEEPFPDIKNLPTPISDEFIERDTNLSAPGLFAVGRLVSWICRSLVTIARDNTLVDIPTDPISNAAISYESAVYVYSLLRDDVCSTLDSFISPEIAHNNPEICPALRRVAEYMEKTVEYLIKPNEDMDDSLYAMQKGKEVSPLYIKANLWIPTVDYRNVVSMRKEEPPALEEWENLETVIVGPAEEHDLDA